MKTTPQHMDRLRKNLVTDSCIGCFCHGCDSSHETVYETHDATAQDIVAFLDMHSAFGNLKDPFERKIVDHTTRDWECGNRAGCDTIDDLYDLRSQELFQESLHPYATVVSRQPSFLQKPAVKIVLLYNSIRRRI